MTLHLETILFHMFPKITPNAHLPAVSPALRRSLDGALNQRLLEWLFALSLGFQPFYHG
jgi:hypothetical protein